VEVCSIDRVIPHANADKLEIAVIKGWQCIVPKSAEYRAGDKVVYFPPDTMIPLTWAERFGVTNYLSIKSGEDMGRIFCTKLRGEPSFGLIVNPENPDWEFGQDVADFYGAKKYLPPIKFSDGDAERENPLFVQYTEIENYRNFPHLLQEGEEVSITEKIHGTNCRVGLVDGVKIAGSHKIQRRQTIANGQPSRYWLPWEITAVQALMTRVQKCGFKQIILYGEIYGPGIQNLHYDARKAPAFRAFDLLADGHYFTADVFRRLGDKDEVPLVPELYRGPWSQDLLMHAAGKSTLGNHIREGCVIKPVAERRDPEIGRVVLKYISDDYLLGRKEDYTDA